MRYLDSTEEGPELGFGGLHFSHVHKILFTVACEREVEALPSIQLERGVVVFFVKKGDLRGFLLWGKEECAHKSLWLLSFLWLIPW